MSIYTSICITILIIQASLFLLPSISPQHSFSQEPLISASNLKSNYFSQISHSLNPLVCY